MMEEIKVWYYKEGKRNNFGDLLGDYIPRKITNKKIVYTNINSPNIKYLTVGSILNQMIGVNRNCIVWGSGIMTKNDTIPKDVKLLAVRGPYTQKRLRDIGITPPDVIGDPALILKNIYNPKIEKKYKVGIIPHYVDFEYVKNKLKDNENIKVIDLITNNIEKTIDDILSCENTISSSLHGVIVSHTYNIPSVWVKFSEKLFGNGVSMGNNIKFRDYFSSVGIDPYDGLNYKNKDLNIEDIMKDINRHQNKIVNFDFERLWNSCPFLK